ncbi:HAAS signaling domain-containing protein [Brevibacterium album]|uniref:HAAS signaling domain-containing protein n=1 Tax=Brevibacterium album TaxID=417948 RepID=UPI000413CD38|nr:hypothetical protein [Brevibacterium album]
MTALTERYVDVVLAHVPEDQREEIGAEIHAMIADMVEARQSGAADPADAAITSGAAEREVLEQLGDPAALAREYARTPQHLIGPDWYPVYMWALRWILPLVGVAALLVNGIVYSATEARPQLGGLIGTALGQTVGALLIAFATLTILLAVVERTSGAEDRSARGRLPGMRPWTVEQLGDRAASGSSVRADALVSLVLIALLAAVPVIPTSFLYVGHLNGGEPFVNPGLAAGWFLGYWGLLALLAATEVWKAVRARLTPGPAFAGITVDVLIAAFLTVALLTQRVLHPALGDEGLLDGALGTVLAVAAVWAIFACDLVSTLRALRESRR